MMHYGVHVKEPAHCVYSGNVLDWDSILQLEELFDEDECDCEDGYCECESETKYYADAEWAKGADGKWDAPGATIILSYNSNDNDAVVFKSPETWMRGGCSPCCPGAGDANSKSNYTGTFLCYKLPDEYICQD